jgi:small subunit ribosomal protein S7
MGEAICGTPVSRYHKAPRQETCRVPVNIFVYDRALRGFFGEIGTEKTRARKGRDVPRKGSVPKRDILPDPIYNSVFVARLVNNIMLDGKKGVAQSIVYDAFERIRKVTGEEPLEIFQKALNNIMPVLEVKARRVGGANYQVPIEVRADRRQTLGLRWLTKYTRSRGEKTMSERLAKEVMDAANNTGASVKKKEDTHKMAEANRAFAHYRW